MNLMEESFKPKKEDKSKKMAKIVLVCIVLIVFIIIGVAIAMVYVQSNTLKLTINGVANEKVKQMLVFDGDKIYVPIKEIASYLGYECYNGEYNDKSEDPSKCYIQGENEITNFSLNSNKIYKLNLQEKDANYEYFYIDEPIIARNGVLYTTTEGMETAFNVSFEYNEAAKTITIFTLPYLVQGYSSVVLDYGYVELSDNFTNQKAILQDMLVVKKDKENNKDGVVEASTGNTIIEAKYDNITYLPNSGEFKVESNKKVGIITKTKDTRVQLIYDSIELMDSDAGLYVVKRDDKYGVIDTRGNIKIYVEYDEIGIDPSQFEKNDIKNGYILVNNLIPVRKDKLWGLYNKNGKLIVDIEYDSFGYIASSNKDAMNLLVIPNYDVIVTCSNKKYGLINSSGRVLIGTLTDDIYLTIESGENRYYMTYNNNKLDVEEYLDSQGIVAKDEDGTVLNANEVKQNDNNTNTTEEQNDEQNNVEQQNEVQNSNNEQQNGQQEESSQQSNDEQNNGE